MRYLSAPLAFCVYCELDTPGEWRGSRELWSDNNFNNCMRDSEDSPFKEYGIEMNRFLQYKPLCTYHVANHVRAYLDMLYEGRFNEMEGMFLQYINNGECRRAIFEQVLYRCKHLASYQDINAFMTKEFGNAWVSFVDAIYRSSMYIGEAVKDWNPSNNPEDTMPDISTLVLSTPPMEKVTSRVKLNE